MIYDEENRLTQVSLRSGPTVNYKYDGLGRRIQRTTSAGANERYVYDGHDALIDLNADWSVATTYFNDLGIDNHLRRRQFCRACFQPELQDSSRILLA